MMMENSHSKWKLMMEDVSEWTRRSGDREIEQLLGQIWGTDQTPSLSIVQNKTMSVLKSTQENT